MAKKPGSGSGGGGGGGGAPKKPNMTFQIIKEGAEFAVGLLAAQVVSAGSRGLLEGLQKTLIEKLLPGKKDDDMAKEAKAEDISKAKGDLKQLIKANGGDAKLAQFAEDYLDDLIGIRVSARTEADKELAIRQARFVFRANVNARLLELSRSSFKVVMETLTKDEAEKFTQWLHRGLTRQQRAMVLIQKDHITSPDLIRKMLELSGNSTDKYNFLMTALPKVTITEHLGSALEAVVTGQGGQHPLVQSVEKALKDSAAEQIKTIKAAQANPDRKRRNSL